MEQNEKAWTIAKKMMYDKDGFSQWFGMEILAVGQGTATVTMKVEPHMTNGFGIAHGGITYGLADSAFAFASNSQGKKAVSIETSISHLAAVHIGDQLTAHAIEENLSRRLGVYTVKIFNQTQTLVAHFKGTVFRKDEEWLT